MFQTPLVLICLGSRSLERPTDMASRKALVLNTCRTRGTNLLRRAMGLLLSIISCGLIRSVPNKREITDRYGNTYSFGHDTTDEQITAILSIPTGEISTACNNVHSAFAKTDNLEIMIAPTKSKTNTADNWRIVHSCPDTGSGICLIALNVAQQAGIILNPIDDSKVYTASGHAMEISGTAKALVKIEDSVHICDFWVTPMMRDRLLLSRQQLMTFNIIPKTFPRIMRPKDEDTQMCQTCANIVRRSHFEKLGKNHFVSLVDKNAPDGKVNSKDFYKSVINTACKPCQKI